MLVSILLLFVYLIKFVVDVFFNSIYFSLTYELSPTLNLIKSSNLKIIQVLNFHFSIFKCPNFKIQIPNFSFSKIQFFNFKIQVLQISNFKFSMFQFQNCKFLISKKSSVIISKFEFHNVEFPILKFIISNLQNS